MYGHCKVHGVAMGSPLGLTQTNAFLVHFEENWLQNCPFDLKPYYYRRYIDDIFVLFTSPKHLKAFQNFLNGRQANMSFTIASKTQCLILMDRLFLNIKHLPLLSTVNLV